MQTHLANCEHILDHEEVLDEIVLSSEEEAEDDTLHHPLAPLQSHIANNRLDRALSASSANASPTTRNVPHAIVSPIPSGLSRVSSIESNPPNQPTTMETNEALLQFTLENNLPFDWVESTVMQTLCPQLPSAAEFAGPILHRIQQSYEQKLHDRQREMHQSCGWTLIVQELSVKGNIGTFVSWLTHPNGAIFPSVLDTGESLRWSSPLNQVSRVVQTHILENLRRQINVVAVTLPPVDSYFNALATTHTNVLFLASTSTVFNSMYYYLLNDELCHRALQSAATIAPPPQRLDEAGNWLEHVLTQRFLDGTTRSLVETILPFFKELAATTHGTLSLAQTTKLYHQLYRAVVCLPQRQNSLQQRLFGLLETSWASLEQPVFILAYTLQPHYRDQYLKKSLGAFKWSSICDVACYYYDRWFHTRPTTLRGDVMAYAHVTQHVFAPSVVSEFPSINDYILYLNDHAPELSRLMAHLQTIVTNFSFESDASDIYSEEIAQNLNYILYCQAKSMPKRNALSPQTQLAAWKDKTSTMDRSAEVAIFKKLVPGKSIETCSPEQLQATLEYSRYRKLRLRLRFPENYPSSELIIEIMSNSLPDITLRRLTKFADTKAKELSKENKPQVQSIVELIQTSLTENKLLCSFDEIRQLRLLVEKNNGEIKLINERAGRIKIMFRKNTYFFQVNLKLDDLYPDSPIKVICDESNFPPSVVDVMVKQANEMVRRIIMGYTADQALYASNPLRKPLSLLSINDNDSKNAAPGAKKFGKNAKAAPIPIKESPVENISPMYYAEDGGILHRSPLDDAVKSILPVCRQLLWEKFIQILPTEKCPECTLALLSENPTDKIDEENSPLMAYCGHWYHTDCLGKKLQTPPFAHGCKVCNVILHHPKWPSDLNELQQRYERAQRLEREIADIADMF
ncbi:hypothetical protein THRCLA_00159 [Thraustotheca clavata]|uniref:RWD domain-containing protein n=1 Tax=Thraustotheca clavata TaxID=74557 RepID=A0A1W0AC01_9STRA|nr:hypothetical protein THRCLA_00159 [Thraustotheca clavata]